ncbi:hypothetical protein SSX86_016091 [Deinandra increscens subsp. villosa]|uniref:non-specific serine/threonine protein kinase n=1 Tax=Deinandra increscens subsp. villosa TaxID=3103831 RepID=A0AAP0GXS1_9ASTR
MFVTFDLCAVGEKWHDHTPSVGDHHVVMIPPVLKPPLSTRHSPFITTSSSGTGGSGSNNDSKSTTFTYEELAVATDGFSDANLLGQGGFGYVHKGVLPNGKEVAVKQLKVGSRQGEREFQAEVEIINRVHHKHLVSLLGYCITGSQRLVVYEFVPNNTLEFHLHDKNRPVMEFSTRLRIALGTAKGLAYIHEDCNSKIIHRDIKAANILLDFTFEAKVADFGLAKITSDVTTHVSTRVMGTFGYLAPEYASTGKLTEKSDVFSYGVMLLELITGRKPVDSANYTFMDDILVDWARPLLTQALEDGNFDLIVDPRLQRNYNHNEMARMLSCLAESTGLRPVINSKSMTPNEKTSDFSVSLPVDAYSGARLMITIIAIIKTPPIAISTTAAVKIPDDGGSGGLLRETTVVLGGDGGGGVGDVAGGGKDNEAVSLFSGENYTVEG